MVAAGVDLREEREGPSLEGLGPWIPFNLPSACSWRAWATIHFIGRGGRRRHLRRGLASAQKTQATGR